MRAAVAGSVLALLAAAALSGCASDTTATTEMPTCADAEHDAASNSVILMAQSVPTAEWVPCLRSALPLGWGFHHLDARSDLSVFSLDSDRDGMEAIKVRLEESCDTSGATRIPSDREDMERLERVTRTTPHFEGKRYYVFDGGCITFDFTLTGDGESRSEGLALATQSVGAVSRTDLLRQVDDDSDGRLSLDPAGDGAP
ncbi:hypothetical protein [Blastococcus sp. CT_GayMR16]|uniref:hypothetical protein n=1 Tax=Blastococcus sp. CT_GayMR16 TaxID=2559607 RepID=UPI0010734A99|nr:hypothetical protein [Blastococcus sp. CT_GayMR16]TFV83373.1 hypothetical protein E4P38_20330 [Blastococcus sp. CT_GayMR16]